MGQAYTRITSTAAIIGAAMTSTRATTSITATDDSIEVADISISTTAAYIE